MLTHGGSVSKRSRDGQEAGRRWRLRYEMTRAAYYILRVNEGVLIEHRGEASRDQSKSGLPVVLHAENNYSSCSNMIVTSYEKTDSHCMHCGPDSRTTDASRRSDPVAQARGRSQAQ